MFQRTICFRLDDASDDAIAALRETLAQSAQCFDAVAAAGWRDRCKNGVELHRRSYYALRARFPRLPSQIVVSARMKATEALSSAIAREKKGLKAGQPRATRPILRYDARSMSLDLANDTVSLASVAGRLCLKLARHRQADRWLKRAVGFDTADLVERPSGLWLNLVLTVTPPLAQKRGDGVIGVDLGVNRPVVTSDGAFIGKRRWKDVEARYFRHRRSLQAKGTKSALRRLRTQRRRQRRFRLDCDRVLAKRLVTQALERGARTIVLENLKGIRMRTKQRGRRQRRRHHGWSYAQLRVCIGSKAEDAGLVVAVIDPRHTSQRCNHCGHTSRLNRPSQSRFSCRDCGHKIDADLNAARNVRWKYLHASAASDDGVARHRQSGGVGGPPPLPAQAGGVNRPFVAATAIPGAGASCKLRPSGRGS